MVVGVDPELKVIWGFLKSWRATTSALVCISRGLNGVAVLPSVQLAPPRTPKRLLKVYELEGCPESRKVRESMTILDLDFIALPCPTGGNRFRQQMKEIGGKDQVPFLVDENTNTKLYGADEIVKYLFSTYLPEGASIADNVPQLMSPGLFTSFSLFLSTFGRKARGLTKKAIQEDIRPPEPTSDCDETKKEKDWIELYGYEASPYTRLVREVLAELELPHIQRTLGKGSHKRSEYQARVGKMQVPYLEDHNPKTRTNGNPVKMFDSTEIATYLQLKYLQDPSRIESEKPGFLARTFPPNVTFGLIIGFFLLRFFLV